MLLTHFRQFWQNLIYFDKIKKFEKEKNQITDEIKKSEDSRELAIKLASVEFDIRNLKETFSKYLDKIEWINKDVKSGNTLQAKLLDLGIQIQYFTKNLHSSFSHHSFTSDTPLLA